MYLGQQIPSPDRALVEIIEFGNITCFRSRQARKTLDEVTALFNDSIVYKYRYFPDLTNNESILVALALEAARRQEKFRPMYNALLTQSVFNCGTVLAQAFELGLDHRQFTSDLLSDCVHDVIKADYQAGYEMGVHHTPTLFVEGQRFYGKLTMSRLAPFIRSYTDCFKKQPPLSLRLVKHELTE